MVFSRQPGEIYLRLETRDRGEPLLEKAGTDGRGCH